jgi:hypothetical protein
MKSIDVILHEIDHLTTVIADDERQVEQRVQFFLTLVAASVSLLAILANLHESDQVNLFPIVLATLAILFVFGLHTLQRLNWRSILVRANHIRMRLAFEQLRKLEAEFETSVTLMDTIDSRRNLLRKIRGSPAELMYLVNSFLLAGLFFTIGCNCEWPGICKLIISFAIFVVGIVAQYQFSYRYRNFMLQPER